jgi:enediyne biosynthesis protein E4
MRLVYVVPPSGGSKSLELKLQLASYTRTAKSKLKFELYTKSMLRVFILIVFAAFVAIALEGSQISFVDVSEKSGLRLERIVSSEKRYLIETMGGGVAFIDYNRDNLLDVYLTNNPTVSSFREGKLPSNRLYRNLGDGTFADVTQKAAVGFRGWSFGVSVADYDGDSYPDIYLTNFGSNVLYHNNADGTFTDVTAKAGVGDKRWSSSSGWADYDRDGDLDLFIANYVDYDLARLPEFGKGRYCIYRSLEVLCGPRGMQGAGDTLYRNNGNGTFSDVSQKAGVADASGAYGLGVQWADLDDDGDQDLYVANDTQGNYLYINQGDGTFREAGLLSGAALDQNGKARAGMGIAAGDYDRDGRLDLGVTNFSEEGYALFRNLGRGEFVDNAVAAGLVPVSLPYLGWGMLFADFDQDGWLDLFAANGHVYPQVDRNETGSRYHERCLVFRNTGRGRFEEVQVHAETESKPASGLSVARAHRGAALGDYDNDGDQDVLVMDVDGGPVLFENRSAGQGSYLRVVAPVGSRITIEAGSIKLIDEVRASGSYQSASEQVAHFGLGSLRIVDRVTVRSSDGRTRTLSAVKVNQTVQTIK